MGYLVAMSPCFFCKKPFSYNPELVPSTRPRGPESAREPICASCMAEFNALRKEKGLAPFPVLPGAYEPAQDGLPDDIGAGEE